MTVLLSKSSTTEATEIFSLYPNTDTFWNMRFYNKKTQKLSNKELFSFQPIHKKNTNSS